jgi:hypothetical protein
MAIFWNVAPCSLVEIDRRFRYAYFRDDRGSKHIWNVDQFLPDYTVQHNRRLYLIENMCDVTAFRF